MCNFRMFEPISHEQFKKDGRCTSTFSLFSIYDLILWKNCQKDAHKFWNTCDLGLDGHLCKFTVHFNCFLSYDFFEKLRWRPKNSILNSKKKMIAEQLFNGFQIVLHCSCIPASHRFMEFSTVIGAVCQDQITKWGFQVCIFSLLFRLTTSRKGAWLQISFIERYFNSFELFCHKTNSCCQTWSGRKDASCRDRQLGCPPVTCLDISCPSSRFTSDHTRSFCDPLRPSAEGAK
jgi:hypothetical protein